METEAFTKYFNKLVRIGESLTTKREKNQILYKLNDTLILMAHGKRPNQIRYKLNDTLILMAHGKRPNRLKDHTAFSLCKGH